MRSLTDITSRRGVPNVHCKGVNDVIGLPNSVDWVSPTVLGISTGIVDDEGGII